MAWLPSPSAVPRVGAATSPLRSRGPAAPSAAGAPPTPSLQPAFSRGAATVVGAPVLFSLRRPRRPQPEDEPKPAAGDPWRTVREAARRKCATTTTVRGRAGRRKGRGPTRRHPAPCVRRLTDGPLACLGAGLAVRPRPWAVASPTGRGSTASPVPSLSRRCPRLPASAHPWAAVRAGEELQGMPCACLRRTGAPFAWASSSPLFAGVLEYHFLRIQMEGPHLSKKKNERFRE